MRVLVTGASGFVGQALLSVLNAKKYEVVGVSRNTCYLGSNRIYTSSEIYDEALNIMQGCDVVIHLAARVHIMNDKLVNPLKEFLAVNLHDTLKLAEYAASVGVKRFVYVSSIKVNGELTESQPFSELSPSMPQDPYAISKWQAEQALIKLSKITGMGVVIVRPPLVYGPKVKANFLSLLNVVYKGIPLPFGAIKNSRSMIYVGNLVDALIVCSTHLNAAGQTYLVSDGEDVSTPDLIKKIAIALSKPFWVFPFPISVINFLAGLVGKKAAVDRLTQSLVVDSSKIREELGWQPPYSMEQGLKATADWYIQSLNSIKK
jgi:nucleoside-diphosphate-sugar epimerase